MRYFKATVVRGHLGVKYNHGTITFYEMARNALEAMDKARAHGGVKHSRIPVNCQEISKEEYLLGMKVNAYDRAFCRK